MRRPPQLNCHTDLLVHSELHVPVHVLNSPLFFCCCRRRPHTLPSLFSCLHPQVGLGVCEHVPSRGGHLLLSESAASCASVLTLCQTSCSPNSTPPTWHTKCQDTSLLQCAWFWVIFRFPFLCLFISFANFPAELLLFSVWVKSSSPCIPDSNSTAFVVIGSHHLAS